MSQTSILHISDLHRDRASPIRNDALLNSLENDRQRYIKSDDPSVRSPDIIVVSGDIIYGVAPGTRDVEAKLAEQYREALAFLNELADLLVEGDKQRVVVIPGNHDVSACHFMDSVKRLDIAPDRKKEFVSQLFLPDSPLRWSWSEFALFEVMDKAKYANRLAAFAWFYEEFYDGTRSYALDPAKQFDIFDYPDFELTITGFSSCFNNDILNRQAAIHPGCIAEATSELSRS